MLLQPEQMMPKKNNEQPEFGELDFRDFIADFVREPDRAAVILGAAKIDLLLYEILDRYLRPNTSGNDLLLDTDRAIGTFSARIQVVYRLGLIDAEMTKALNLVRRIRNSFAHETGKSSLSEASHKDRVRELTMAYHNTSVLGRLRAMSGLKELPEASRDFRACLALIVARLYWLLSTTTPIDCTNELSLRRRAWDEERKSAKAVKTSTNLEPPPS